jgi:hypothetical protein
MTSTVHLHILPSIIRNDVPMLLASSQVVKRHLCVVRLQFNNIQLRLAPTLSRLPFRSLRLIQLVFGHSILHGELYDLIVSALVHLCR